VFLGWLTLSILIDSCAAMSVASGHYRSRLPRPGKGVERVAPINRTAGEIPLSGSELCGSDPKSAQEYRTALALDDENSEAHLRLGEMLVRKNETQEARQHFQKAVESKKSRIRQAALQALSR